MTGRYLCYPEYRESGQPWCGEIPSHWDFRRTKFLFQIIKRIAGELGHSVLSITQKGIKIKDTESGEGQLSMDYSKYQLVKVGDFAMNHMDLLTGYIDISKYDGVTSPDYRVFCSRASSIVDRYFLYLYQLAYIKGVFFPLGQGSAHLGRWRLPSEEFNGFRWPVPSKKEQEQIANFLDHEIAKIDTLIDKQQQLINLLKEKNQAVISHAVTKGLNPDAPMKDSGVEWLGEVPEHWVGSTRIKYISSLKGRLGWQGLKADEYIDEGPFVVSSAHFDNHRIQWEMCPHVSIKRYELDSNIQLEEGDLLLMKDGAAMGKLAYVEYLPDKACLNSHLLLFRPSKVGDVARYDPRYMYYFMQTDFFQDFIKVNGTGATFLGISQQALANYQIILPSVAEQQEIVKFLDNETAKMHELERRQRSMMDLLYERRTALISAAVTGKIDVRERKID